MPGMVKLLRACLYARSARAWKNWAACFLLMPTCSASLVADSDLLIGLALALDPLAIRESPFRLRPRERIERNDWELDLKLNPTLNVMYDRAGPSMTPERTPVP